MRFDVKKLKLVWNLVGTMLRNHAADTPVKF